MPDGLPSHYDVLGVEPSAAAEEVRQAYRKLARAFHPDINPEDPKAHERMALINVAFEVLSDPVRRMEYDQTIGHALFSEPGQAPGPRRVQAVYAKVAHRHTVHGTPVYGVSYDQTSGRLVSSSFDNELIWWSPGEEFAERRQKLDGGVVSAIQTAPRGIVVAAGSTEQTLACWKLGGNRPVTWRQTPKEWICSLRPSPDGDSLALGTVDNLVRVVSADTGQTRWQVGKHTDSVTALAWSSDSAWLASGSADSTIRIWCATTGVEHHLLDRNRSMVTSLAFSPDGRWLAAAGIDLTVRIFSLDDLQLRQTFFGHEKPIESLAFHPRSWLLGSASRDGSIGLWNVRRGVDHGRIEASHQPISCLAFSPTGLRMAAGGLDKVLRIWDLSSGDESRS